MSEKDMLADYPICQDGNLSTHLSSLMLLPMPSFSIWRMVSLESQTRNIGQFNLLFLFCLFPIRIPYLEQQDLEIQSHWQLGNWWKCLFVFCIHLVILTGKSNISVMSERSNKWKERSFSRKIAIIQVSSFLVSIKGTFSSSFPEVKEVIWNLLQLLLYLLWRRSLNLVRHHNVAQRLALFDGRRVAASLRIKPMPPFPLQSTRESSCLQSHILLSRRILHQLQ